jgi:hypothetical protein
MADGPTIVLALNPVLEERADDFEEWLRTVVVSAMRTHQPELVNMGAVRLARHASADRRIGS